MIYKVNKYDIIELMEDFTDEVSNKSRGLKRLPYSEWKKLKKVSEKEGAFYVSICRSHNGYIDFNENIDDPWTINFETICMSDDTKDFIDFADIWLTTRGCSVLPHNDNNTILSNKVNNTNTALLSTDNYYSNPIAVKTATATATSFYDTIESVVNSYITNKPENERKETKTMNIFSNLNSLFGPVSSNIVRMSPFGLAIKTTNRTWHTYDAQNKKIVDVSDFSFDFGSTPLFYRVPVAPNAVAIGDLILHNDIPVYVIGFADETNKTAGILVIDTDSNEQKTILPVCNVFNFNFVTKVTPLFNMNGTNLFGTPSADQPFGNILPFIMMSEVFGKDNKSDKNDLISMLFMSQMFAGGANPFASMFGIPTETQDA